MDQIKMAKNIFYSDAKFLPKKLNKKSSFVGPEIYGVNQNGKKNFL